jgi:ATP-dependent DNA helicase DinG
MPIDPRHPVIVLAEITGRSRSDQIMLLESVRIENGEIIPEESLLIPSLEDSPRSASPRKVDDFLVSLSERQGFYLLDHRLPGDVRTWSVVTEYLSKSSLIDLRKLLRVLFPTTTARSLSEFRKAFSLSDKIDARHLALRLLEIFASRTQNLSRGLQRRLKKLALFSSRALREWFEAAGRRQPAVDFELDESYFVNLDRFENLTEGMVLECEEIPSVLRDSAESSTLIDGYEFREGQSRYANAVVKALTQDQILLLEGATGTGKSIGYLLPLIARCAETKTRATIVTRTKSLQEQLFRSDLVKIRKLVPPGFRVSLLKGLANYLCLLKYKSYMAQMDTALDAETAYRLMSLAVWEEESKSGDLTETEIFADEQADALRTRITLDEVSCLGSACTYYSQCYAFRARKQAIKSNLVITNYALLFADLLAGRSIMGSFSYAVLDEAHRLEAEATRAFTARLPLLYFQRLFEQLSGNRVASYLTDLGSVSTGEGGGVPELSENVSELGENIGLVAATVRDGLMTRSRGSLERIRFIAGDEIHGHLSDFFASNGETLQEVADWLTDVQNFLATTGDKGSGPNTVELKKRLGTLAEFVQLIRMIAESGPSDLVLWGDVLESGETAITAAPADVGRLLAKRLYPNYEAVVLTSATLESADDFAWVSRQLGLCKENDIESTHFKLGSPFPLSDQLRVTLAAYLPPPDSDRYPSKLAALITKLRQSVRMSTLVLCTSYRMIDMLESSLREHGKLPGEVLIQRPDSSPEKLLVRFQRSEKAVLIGTESFWEGVDLPGDVLRLLVVTRLPFAVPDDPIEQAKGEQATARGENPFVSLSLPAAILKYRQALGRVIRGLSDWGAVIVTDSRMAKKRYGSLFLEASPAEVQVFQQESLLLKDVASWLYGHQRDGGGSA